MGVEALTHGDDGRLVLPETDPDWDDWVAASSTRNHVLDQPLLDWLDRHGKQHGSTRGGAEDLDGRAIIRPS